jgi:hypothetical protein
VLNLAEGGERKVRALMDEIEKWGTTKREVNTRFERRVGKISEDHVVMKRSDDSFSFLLQLHGYDRR